MTVKSAMKSIFHLILFAACLLSGMNLYGQNTQIRGFLDALTTYDRKQVSFGFGEQDLFITSDLNDRVSFLGESVFKFTPSSATQFSVSIERVVIKYNIAGNHNFVIGKHHTPINYWNDTYHHGRVFFPTIDRPLLFSEEIIPLHTTGIGILGHDLGRLRFGYDVMLGNGGGSTEIVDNDKNKSLTIAANFKPADKLRLGASYYYDVISKGAPRHIIGTPLNWQINQSLYTGSVAFFGKKFELLAESTLGYNKSDTTGSKRTIASYIYTGYKIRDNLTPYIRVDHLRYQDGEIYFHKDNTTALAAGLRLQINYLAVIKLEYQRQKREIEGIDDKIVAQFAIGF